MSEFVAVIPVRGGSKGVPGKNMKLLGGKPLYRWVADAAKKSGVFSDIVVCSDWEELLTDAKSVGLTAIRCPDELTTDTASVKGTMAWLCKAEPNSPLRRYDYVQLLQATTPFVTSDHIRGAVKLLQTSAADMVISVCPAPEFVALAKPIPDSLSLFNWYPKEERGKRRQDIRKRWYLNGYIYIAKWAIWAEQKDYWESDIRAFLMNPEDNFDIDTLEDFEYGTWLLSRKK